MTVRFYVPTPAGKEEKKEAIYYRTIMMNPKDVWLTFLFKYRKPKVEFYDGWFCWEFSYAKRSYMEKVWKWIATAEWGHRTVDNYFKEDIKAQDKKKEWYNDLKALRGREAVVFYDGAGEEEWKEKNQVKKMIKSK